MGKNSSLREISLSLPKLCASGDLCFSNIWVTNLEAGIKLLLAHFKHPLKSLSHKAVGLLELLNSSCALQLF